MTPRFRVYHDGTMHYPPHPFMLDDGGAVFRQQDVGPAAPVGPVDADVMLSTGRTDADGAEIWEGSLVRYWSGEVSVVEWHEYHAGFKLSGLMPDASATAMSDCTVIGNVHEHDPEALD